MPICTRRRPPPPVLKMFAARIKRAESVVVPEAGHSTYWEQPDVFTAPSSTSFGNIEHENHSPPRLRRLRACVRKHGQRRRDQSALLERHPSRRRSARPEIRANDGRQSRSDVRTVDAAEKAHRRRRAIPTSRS
jgi:hypothetical protein